MGTRFILAIAIGSMLGCVRGERPAPAHGTSFSLVERVEEAETSFDETLFRSLRKDGRLVNANGPDYVEAVVTAIRLPAIGIEEQILQPVKWYVVSLEVATENGRVATVVSLSTIILHPGEPTSLF